MSDVRLINLRGRVVTVPAHDVQALLKRGFLHIPDDQPEIVYTQIHDKGDGIVEVPVEKEPRTRKRAIVRLGDRLVVEKK